MRDTETGRKERGERGLAVQETWRQRDTQKHINTGMVGVVRKRFGEQQRGTRKQREGDKQEGWCDPIKLAAENLQLSGTLPYLMFITVLLGSYYLHFQLRKRNFRKIKYLVQCDTVRK